MQEQNNITNSLAHGKYSWGIIANSRFVKIVLVKISLHRPCFVDKNAVHGKNLGKHIVFRGFLLLFGQKRDFYAPSKQVSILCCLLTVFHAKQDLNPAIFWRPNFISKIS